MSDKPQYREVKHLHLPEIDREILAFWNENQIFDKSISTREGNPTFVFFEGPPSTNGLPGIHHVMGRTIKDLFCRYQTLKGKQVSRKGGWDTHGLPIELNVEKSLGIRKDDIGVKISVEDYNKHCRQDAMRYIDIWNDVTEKMGYWVDMDNPYITYENEYIESLWWLLQQFYTKGLLYKGYSIQPYSPAAGTGLSSHEVNQPGCYREITDTTVVAMFKVINNTKSAFLFDDDQEDLRILAWTTTPWTLPSNTALTVGPKINYVKIKTTNPYTHQKVSVVLAESLVKKWFGAKNQPSIDEQSPTFTGKQLQDITYEQLLPFGNNIEPLDGATDAFRVILGDFVTTEDGTGVVHTAPSFGADDRKAARTAGIGTLTLVDKQGKFIDTVGEFSGRYVKDYLDDPNYVSVDVDIAVRLKLDNKALNVQKYEHNYPHCWRTDKPILYYPLDSWFIAASKYRDRMSELNQTINWKPAATGEGRFQNWLENIQDWNLSRSRYWGCPLPIWRTADSSSEICIGSLAQLQTEIDKANSILGLNQTMPPDLHRPYIDNITLVSDEGKPMQRELDLIDVWFDSGAMPYAQWHYPFSLPPAPSKGGGDKKISEGVQEAKASFVSSEGGRKDSLNSPSKGGGDKKISEGVQEAKASFVSSEGGKGKLSSSEGGRKDSLNSPSFGGGGGEASYGYMTANPVMYKFLKEKALEMRKNPTQAESVLWTLLRRKNFSDYTFRRQHIIYNYIADFVCLNRQLIVEADGDVHDTLESIEHDRERERILTELGFTTLRFRNEEIIAQPDEVVAKIKETLAVLPITENIVDEEETEAQTSPLGEGWEGLYPADFIAEGVDQTRGWFYTLHAISVMLFDSVAYKNVVSNGLLLDENGVKMSKRLGNVVDPFVAMDKYGADTVRWYIISNSNPWDNLKFSWKKEWNEDKTEVIREYSLGMEEVRNKFLGTLYNTYSFFALYANIDGFNYSQPEVPLANRPEIDRWILSLLNSLVKKVDTYYATYDATPAARLIQEFVSDHLSNWYVRLCRRRFWKGDMGVDKLSAYQTLYRCLEVVCQLASPIAPFITDFIFRNLNNTSKLHPAESVHLSQFPVANNLAIDTALEERMMLAQTASSLVLALRKKADIKVRQPLQKILVPVLTQEQKEQFEQIEKLILAEVNVKEIQFVSDTSGIVTKSIKPDLKKLGKKLGAKMKAVTTALAAFSQDDIKTIEQGSYDFNIDGETITVLLDEVLITSEDIKGWMVNSDKGVTVALDVNITPELAQEGIARELINRLQNLRKTSNFNVTDRINVQLEQNELIANVIENTTLHQYICSEVLADSLTAVPHLPQTANTIDINEVVLGVVVELNKKKHENKPRKV